MATIKTTGIDEMAEKLARIGQLTGDVAEEMLTAGAQEVSEGIKTAIKKYDLVDTGAMLKAVRADKRPKKESSGTMYVDIYPRGKDRKGVRNAEKAFVAHYGKKGQNATHFMNYAEEISAEKTIAVMQSIMNDFIEKENK